MARDLPILPDFLEHKAANLARVPHGRTEAFLERLNHSSAHIAEGATGTNCLRDGYAPPGYGLADFTVLRKNDSYHLFYIPRVPGNSCLYPGNEHWFGHAVSHDLNTWVTLDPILFIAPENYYESAHIWAPYVLDHAGQTWMFYTGLSGEPSQVLCSAISSDPALAIWKRAVNNPIIPIEGFDWHWRNSQGHVRQARDPHVVPVNDVFLLAYTTMCENGCPSVGGMVSKDLSSWQDIGPILHRPFGPSTWMPESVLIQPLPDCKWVLVPSAGGFMEYYISDNPFNWHHSLPTRVNYTNGSGREPMGLEVLQRVPGDPNWLVAFFEQERNRFFVGDLCTKTHPWTLTRYGRPSELPALLHVANPL